MSDECKHGSLRRSCEICERDVEIDRLRAECIDLKTDLQGHMDAVAELRAEHIDLKKVNDSVVSLKLEMEPWVRALGLLTTLKADLEIDAEHPGLMAREIFKWVKEKDKRIDELEEALSKSIMHQKELDRCAHITTEQIDKRWKYLSEIGSKGVADGYEQALYDLGFRRCEECGGSGRTYQHTSVDTASFPCHSCHGHGWKVASDE